MAQRAQITRTKDTEGQPRTVQDVVIRDLQDRCPEGDHGRPEVVGSESRNPRGTQSRQGDPAHGVGRKATQIWTRLCIEGHKKRSPGDLLTADV